MRPIALLVILSISFLSSCSRPGGPDRKQVRLAVTLGSFGHIPVFLASALGYFAEEGIEVTIAEMGGSSKVMEALLGGSVEVGAGGFEQTIQMAAEGRAIQSFITVFHNFGFSLAASPRSKHRAPTIGELRGATIGVSSLGSGTHLLVNHLLIRHGLRPADVSAVAIGLGASNLSALEQGRVDAGMTTPTVLIHLRQRHPETAVLFDPLREDTFRAAFGSDRYPSHVLFAHKVWIQGNTATVRSLAKAVLRALRFIAENPPETIVAKLPAAYRSADPAVDIEALRAWHGMYSRDGRLPPESFDVVKRFVAHSIEKVRTATIDPATTYTNEFVENAR